MKQNYWASLLWFLASCIWLAILVSASAQNDLITPEIEALSLTWLIVGIGFFALAVRALPRQMALEDKMLMGGSLAIFLFMILSTTLTWAGQRYRRAMKQAVCLSNVKQLSLASIMYADDTDGRFPIATTWRSATAPYSKDNGSMRCPFAKSLWTYAANPALSSTKSKKVANLADLVFLFEADSKIRDAVGGPESFVTRHDERGSIAFADGHARFIYRAKALALVWRPESR